MTHRLWAQIIFILACLPASPLQAQLLSDPGTLRHTLQAQTKWADSLASAREVAALRFLDVSRHILTLPEGPGLERTQLLVEAQTLSERVASLDQERTAARTLVRQTREHLVKALEARISSLAQAAEDSVQPERGGIELRIRELEAEMDSLRPAGESGDGDADAGIPGSPPGTNR